MIGSRGERGDCTALVLSGGGARGAYQVGVLQGLLEMGVLPDRPGVFPIIAGNSAGSLNGAMLAAHAESVPRGIAALAEVWSDLRAQQVFRTDLPSVAGIAWRWLRDLSFGGLLGRVEPKSLLDTAPLRTLLARVPFGRISEHVAQGRLRALAVAATEYASTDSVLFVQGSPHLDLWNRVHMRVERAEIGIEHLMASSAIPIFFPSVSIGGRHFGDGCIRNTTPLGPVIRLGADRVVAIGVREPRARAVEGRPGLAEAPCVAEVVGSLLDALMLDALEVDVERCERVNRRVAGPTGDGEEAFRDVEVLWIGPSRSIATLALQWIHRIPLPIRYLLRGLGRDRAAAELASYLLFDAGFCRELIRLGHRDVWAEEPRVRAFFAGERPRG